MALARQWLDSDYNSGYTVAMIVAKAMATRWLHVKMALDGPACLTSQQLDLVDWPRLLGPQTSCR